MLLTLLSQGGGAGVRGLLSMHAAKIRMAMVVDLDMTCLRLHWRTTADELLLLSRAESG